MMTKRIDDEEDDEEDVEDEEEEEEDVKKDDEQKQSSAHWRLRTAHPLCCLVLVSVCLRRPSLS